MSESPGRPEVEQSNAGLAGQDGSRDAVPWSFQKGPIGTSIST